MSEPSVLECLVCGDEAMMTISGMMITGDNGAFSACPLHVDTAFARLQDEIHTTMEEKAGILNDWYLDHHPELRPDEPEPDDGETTAESGPVEMQVEREVQARGEATGPDDMTITATAVEEETEAGDGTE